MRSNQKTLVALVSAVLAVAPTSVALSQQGNDQNGGGRGGDRDPCNAVAAAIGGAVLGALLGGGKHRAGGAAIGAAAGAAGCLAVNYHARQVKTAQQVNQEFQNAHGGQPPVHATVVRYETRFDPTDKVQAGGSSNLSSYIEVAAGADGVQPVIEEEITLYDPDGKALKTVRKPANAAGATGGFQTQFSFTMPAGVMQGVYPFKTALYVNGTQVQGATATLQVVKSERAVTDLSLPS